jgi:hypothetical protein
VDRATLEQLFREARERVALVGKHIRWQRQTIRDLEQSGDDATSAKAILKTLEDAQVAYFLEAERLTRKLALFPP